MAARSLWPILWRFRVGDVTELTNGQAAAATDRAWAAAVGAAHPQEAVDVGSGSLNA
jgi:hypothetical protein